MKISDFRKICQKNANEPYWISRYFIRKISFYFTYLFAILKVKANTITSISLLFAFSGSAILLSELDYKYIWSGLFVFIFYFLDHIDGELARFYNYQSGNKDSSIINIGGKYYDRIVHYFQGSSFYFCLGFSLFLEYSDVMWVFLGLLAGIGSSGFPRFTSCFDLLNVVSPDRSEEFFKYLDKYSKFNVVHFSEEDQLTKTVTFPRSISDLVLIARQLIGFPGNITMYFVVIAISSSYSKIGYNLYGVFLLFYAIVLFVNTVYSTNKYLKILSKIPK